MPNHTDPNRLLVWSLVGSQFAPPFLFSGVAVALPALGAELGASATQLGLVESLFLAGGMAFLLPAGRLADAGDKGALYRLALLSFGLLSLAIASLSSLPAILVLRLLQGLMSAVFSAAGIAILADVVPRGDRGRVFGASMGVVYAGLTLGPLVAGWLVHHLGWRSVFVGGAGATLLGWALVLRHLPGRLRWPRGTVHLPSSLLVVASSSCAVAASALLRNGVAAAVLLGLALILAMGFALLQLRLPSPLLDLRALSHSPVLASALLVQGVVYLNAYCSTFLLSLFLQVSQARPARTAGLVLALGTVLMALVAPLAGRLADRARPRLVAAAGVVLVTVSAVLGATLRADSGMLRTAAVLLVQGIGFGLFSSPNMAVIMGNAAGTGSGMASALAAKARSVGMVTGMLLAGGMIALDYGSAPVQADPPRFVGTMTTVYAVLAGSGALALLLAVLGGRRR